MEENKEYWNRFGLLKAQTFENDQNGLLRFAYYHLFSQDVENVFTAQNVIFDYMHDDGRYAQHPETTWLKDRASHDEMSAILYFLTKGPVGQALLKKIKIGYYFKYLQIFFHLLAIKYKSKIFTFIAGLIILISVYKKEKAKNGRWDTDSELLALIKLETYKGRGLEQFFETQILKRIQKNWGIIYQKTLIDTMLWYAPDHPLRVIVEDTCLINEIYG